MSGDRSMSDDDGDGGVGSGPTKGVGSSALRTSIASRDLE